MALAVCVVVVACLLFGIFLVVRTGDAASLREGGRYIAKIPMPRVMIRVSRRGAHHSGKSARLDDERESP